MGFESCHPMVNFIYFIFVILGILGFKHPVFLLVSFICAFCYGIKRGGIKVLICGIILLPLIVAYGFYYATYNHFGITVLKQNMIGNNITLESLVFGITRGVSVAGLMLWLSCVYSIFTTDKVVYLLGKISPKLAMIFTLLLRLFPRLKLEAKKINRARTGIGRGINQGNIIIRFINAMGILSILITWLIDTIGFALTSMKSRGSALKGRRAFSIYRFDNRDRAYVILMFTNLTVIMAGVILNQTDIIYNPRIIYAPITTMSYLFYVCYGVFCIMPLVLELWVEYSFYRSKKSILS